MDDDDRLGLIGLLGNTYLFSGLGESDLSFVADRVEILRYRPGELIFGRNETASRFFIVRSGETAIGIRDACDRFDEKARFAPGDAVGDIAFASGDSFGAEAIAVTDAELVAFPGGGRSLDDIARERPETAAAILLRSMAMIGDRVRSVQKLISGNVPWVRELRKRLYTEPATGLWSRSFLDEEIPKTLGASAALVVMKPDRFKDLVDANGHAAGDAAMTLLAAALSARTEELGRGWAVRLKSNETAIVVPDADARTAGEIAGKLRAAVGAIELPASAGAAPFRFSASVASGSWPRDDPEWPSLFDRVYGAMLDAWRAGGDRAVRVARSGQNGENPP
ncbi:MAG: diguanylate cyclase [Spirochaetes bacterium]|nr:diguanylate cyclase [Spirochaetota bacterium]